MAVLVPVFSIVCMENNLTASSSRRSRQTACDSFRILQSILVEYRVEQFVEFLRLAAEQSSLLIDKSLANQVHGNLHHRRTGTLSVTCLQEPQFAFLYGKLHILHIVIVVFELVLQEIKLFVDFRHSLFH